MQRILIVLVLSLSAGASLFAGRLSPEAYRSQVLELFDDKQFDQIITLCKTWIKRDPDYCEPYRDLVRASAVNGSLDRTGLYLEGLQRKNPGNHCVEYGLGLYFQYMEEYEPALSHFQTARELNPEYYGSYKETGWTFHARREYAKAREFYRKAIDAAKDSSEQADAEVQLAVSHLHLGDPYAALQWLSEAANLSLDNPADKAIVLTRMAEAYLDLGLLAEAKGACEEALQIHTTVNRKRLWYDYQTLGDIYLAFGDLHLASGDIDNARAAYEGAVDYYEQTRNEAKRPEERLTPLVSIAEAHFRKGDEGRALQYYESFLKEADRAQQALREDRSRAMGGIGEIHLRRGQYDQALFYLNEAVALARQDKNKRLELSWMKRIGDVYARSGNYEKARSYYDAVLQEVKDGFLEGKGSQETSYVFFEVELDVYEAMVDLLLEMDKKSPGQGYAKEAFDYLEKARSQSMLHVFFRNRMVEKLLQEPSSDGFRQTLAALQNEVDSKHRAKLARRAKIRPQDTKQSERLKNEITGLDMEIEILYRRIVSLIKQKLLERDKSQVVERIQREVLAKNQVLIEYLVTEEKTFVFLVRRDQFYYETIPVGRSGHKVAATGRGAKTASLKQWMRRVSPLFPLPNEALSERRAIGEPLSANIQLGELHGLYKTIFQPIEKYLRPGTELIIVPDDVLYYLPFEMLVTRWALPACEHLLARYPISYAYSAGLLLEMPKASPGQASLSLLVANPDFGPAAKAQGEADGWLTSLRASFPGGRLPPLPHAEEEIKRIRPLVTNPVALVGAQATEEAFKGYAPAAGIIYAATHSFFNRSNYLDSGIVLAGEQVLYLYEIMSWDLKARLAVLTGCETSLGRLRRGGGLEGISRAFLSAGVPSVVGTLWPVADSEAMPKLMAGFFKYLTKGMNKREALQKAKLDLIAEGRYADPFFWSSLILIGDPGKIDSGKKLPWALLAVPILIVVALLLFFSFRRNGRVVR